MVAYVRAVETERTERIKSLGGSTERTWKLTWNSRFKKKKKGISSKFQVLCIHNKIHSFWWRRSQKIHMENHPSARSGDGNLVKVLWVMGRLRGARLSPGLEPHLLLLWFHQGSCQRSPGSIPYHLLLSHRLTEFSTRGMKRPGEICKYLEALRLTQKEKSGNWYASIV